MTGVIWSHFLSFLDVLVRSVETTTLGDPERTELIRLTKAARLPGGPACEVVLRTYFDQPPAHAVAVNTLDHSQFLIPVALPGCPFPLREVLAAFSHVPIIYSDLWPGRRCGPWPRRRLALLDVAECSNACAALNCSAGREYIRAQRAADTAPLVALPSMDGLLGGVLAAFPGFQECMARIVGAQGSNRPEDVGAMMDQMQSIIMGPVMDSIRTANPDAPDIGPAVSKLLLGQAGAFPRHRLWRASAA
jgi:hypothetical protein